MKKTSTKPKGATSYKETKFGIIPRSKLLPMEIEGTKKGLDYIFRLVSKDKSIEITPELICQLHQKAFGWIFPKWAGKYRKIIEAVKLLAWFQHKFVFIHPFQDYNGRTDRMLTILLLLKLGLPPTEIKAGNKTDRKRYIQAMQKADGGDISLLENIISESFLEGLKAWSS